jgi:hypothetical protein
MKQDIITSSDLLKYMNKKDYVKFIKEIRTRMKIPVNEPLWIIAQQLEKKDYF